MRNPNARELIIVGASGLGKEVAWLALRLGVQIKGFLDDAVDQHAGSFYGYPVLGPPSAWPEFDGEDFIVAIAAPRVRKRVVVLMLEQGVPSFRSLIDPDAMVEVNRTMIGAGSVVCAGSVVTADVSIGDHCIINKLCSVGHDVVISDYTTVAPKVMLGGHVQVETGVEIGACSAVRQGARIGTGAMIGMGGVVLRDVPANSVMVGSPVTQLKTLEAFPC